MKFLAVHQVSLMTHRDCCVDCPFPYPVTGVVWEPRPPCSIMGRLFKLAFCRLTLSTLKRCHMDLWLAQLVLTHHHLHQLQLLLSANITRSKSEYSSSFLSVVFFSDGLPFALYMVRLRAFVQLPFLSRCFVRVALVQPTSLPSGCLDCCLIGVVVGQSH